MGGVRREGCGRCEGRVWGGGGCEGEEGMCTKMLASGQLMHSPLPVLVQHV